MSHQDRMSECITNHQTIKQVADRLLPARAFAGMTVRLGSTWKPRMLAVAALLWGGGNAPTLVKRFEQARSIVSKVFRWQNAPGKTYQGFMQVLRKWHSKLRSVVTKLLRAQIEQDKCWRTGGFAVFAGDGSRCELSRTKSNEAAFSPSKKRKKKAKTKAALKRRRHQRQRRLNKAQRAAAEESKKSQSAESVAKKASSPQLWLTLLWHVGTGLPWAWRTGPSDSSERDHLREMLSELPEKSLITSDAGFVGYDFWRSIIDAHHHFLIRVGGNVKLLTELHYAREHGHTVYLWPSKEAKKLQPPLVLRLIVLSDGKRPVYLVTDLPKSKLSDSQAAAIYAKRWGIELFFRTFKQTFERRRLRSHAGENCPIELDWSLMALWSVCLLGRQELIKAGQDGDRLSPAKAIHAFRETLNQYRVRPETPDKGLMSQLRHALLDDYERTSSKTSRDYPRQKKRERVGPPVITRATKEQIQRAQQVKQLSPEFDLPA